MFSYRVATECNFSTYKGFDVVCCVFALAIFSSFGGAVIEFFQKLILKQEFNKQDVLRCISGSIIATLFYFIAPNIKFISDYLFYSAIIICGLELIRALIVKFRK
jgi:hypothetical protein